MKSDLPENQDASLDKLLNELSFEPTSAVAASHQAPQGLRQRILLAQQQAATPIKPVFERVTERSTENDTESRASNWFHSPWRAIAASAAPLLLGILLGNSTSAAEFYAANIDTQDYPDNDQLLVIAGLDSDFTAFLDAELPQAWAQDGEPESVPTSVPTSVPGNGPLPGANTP